MLKSLTKNKTLLLGILLVILTFIVYNSFFRIDGTSFVADPAVKTIGADIVKTYTDLQSVSFNQKLFERNDYVNLVDFGANIPEQPVGRANPFDLLGRN